MNRDIEFNFYTSKDEYKKLKRKFKRLVKVATKLVPTDKDRVLSLRLTTAKEVKALNVQYRGKDSSTDVLSFVSDVQSELGDILIDIAYAKKQAKQKKHSIQYELMFLFTHGILHLLGLDHKNDKEEKYMDTKTKEVLAKAKVKKG